MLTLIAMPISNQFTGINRNLQYGVDAVKLFLAEQIESTAITPAVEAEVLDDKAKSARNGGKGVDVWDNLTSIVLAMITVHALVGKHLRSSVEYQNAATGRMDFTGAFICQYVCSTVRHIFTFVCLEYLTLPLSRL